MNLNKEQGFTLIELIMVIVILGILAATALPKFADMSNDARKSALQGAYGAINSAITIAHSQALMSNQTGQSGEITLEGNKVKMVYGYPEASADGIEKAVALSGDLKFTTPGKVIGFSTTLTDNSKCQITYTAATDAKTPAKATLPSSIDCS